MERYGLFTGFNTCGRIENCSIVLSGTILTCKNCDLGHILVNNNTLCIPLNKNLNCLENYPQTSTDCKVCKNGYFLDNNKKCTNIRDGKTYISNCAEGGYNYDCKKCNPNHQIVPKFYDCFDEIENCIYYSVNGTCLICNNSLLPSINGKYCNRNPINIISGCAIYFNTSCRSCRNGLYLKSNKCIKASLDTTNNFCTYNPISGLDKIKYNPTNIFDSNKNILLEENNCKLCFGLFLVDTVNKSQCIPPLHNGSKIDPYKFGTCKNNQIRVRFQNKNINIENGNTYSCRSIESLYESRYKLDPYCYIHKTLPIFSFIKENTICAVCKHGYKLDSSSNLNFGKRCISIANCSLNNSYFGGCSSCNIGTLDIDGESCLTSIENCKVSSRNVCIQCNDNFIGILNVTSTFRHSDALSKLLGFGNILAVNGRLNNIKIPTYKYFFYSNTSEFNFSQCTKPLNLRRNNRNIYGIHSASLSTTDRDRVLAINYGERIAAYCRSGNYMMYLVDNLSFDGSFLCAPINNGSDLINIFDNNFLNQAVSKQCESPGTLIISTAVIKGPFCADRGTWGAGNISANPIIIGEFYKIINCALTVITWPLTTANITANEYQCIFCGGSNIPNFLGYCVSIPSAATVIVTTCIAYDVKRNCIHCPLNMSIANNACVNGTQILYTGTTLTQFRNSNNCDRVSWNQNLTTIGFNQAFIGIPSNNNNLIATCETCQNNLIMNYTNFKCIYPNKFNFDNCISTQNGVGCVSCSTEFIQFGVNSQLELCITTPTTNSDFINNEVDYNCIIYNYNISSKYECVVCIDTFTPVNGVCKSNSRVNNCMTLENTNDTQCSICNNGYYLNNNICFKGNIYKCLGYTSQFVCNRCEIGYTLWGTSSNEGRVACIHTAAIRSSFSNCTEIRTTNISQEQQLYCYCKNGRLPLRIINNSICLPNYIPNCKAYNKNNLTQCILCNSDTLKNSSILRHNLYIVSNNRCLPRSIKQIIPNCSIYVENKEICNICNLGYYVNSNGLCIKNPSGLANCMYPLIDGTCLLCNKNYYLKKNFCFEVPLANRISNCYRYNSYSSPHCIICNREFLLNLNYNPLKCEKLNINSSPFLDENKNCIFDIINGYINNKCICKKKNLYFNSINRKCEKKNYCKIVDSFGVCTECFKDMFYNYKLRKCDIVPKKINNCKLYNSEGRCSKCFNNFALVNKSCIPVKNMDKIKNCNSYTSLTKCLLCDLGYYNKNGFCLKLENNSYISDKNKALICKSGFEMNLKNECNPNPKIKTSIRIIKFIFIIFYLKF